MRIKSFLLKILYFIIYRFRAPKLYVSKAYLSGDGSFVDVRYWISKPDKVNFNKLIYLIDEKNSEKLGLMRLSKLGVIRTKHKKPEQSGILLFYNKNNSIQKSDFITLAYGEFIVRHIKVN